MTSEQDEVQRLRAELAEERAERRRLSETLRVMVETQARERAAEAERKAARSARNARHRTKAPPEASHETRTETSHPPAPSPSPPPSFSLSPPSAPSPSILYPFSPASPPPPPAKASSAAADPQVSEGQAVLLQVAPATAETPADLQALWNAEAHPCLPRWQGMSEARKRRAAARLRERPLQAWGEVIRRLSASPFCRGEEGGTGWKASPDWLLQPDVADKVMEGNYDRPGHAPPRADASAGRGGTDAACEGCGVEGQCAGSGGVLLGYACGCMSAWMGTGLPYTDCPEWARNRRAGRAA